MKDFLFYKAPNKPPLFYTLCAKKYALFFLNLLKNQLDDYQIATLFNSTDAYGMSAFHKLVVSMHGEIILNYLKNNNGWLSHLSVDLLTRVINKNNRQYTLLNELCETGSRNIILNMWIKSSMQIDELQLFHFTQEYHLGGGDDKYDEKFSGFYLLSQNTENNDTLQVLLNANSNLYCISPAALFAIKTETSNFPNTSIFYNLIESERGQKILAKIIDFNENLSTTIQVQHVLEPANTFISDMKETIPLYWLAFHYAETGLLHKIKNWEQFIENIHFRESLYKNFAKDKNEVINIARYLTESERGLNLLLSFLKNKQLAYLLLGQNSHKGALELDKKKHGDFFNIPEMQAFLYSLIENEHFKSEEIINLMLQKKIPHPESMEKIYNLTQSIPGLWLLNLLCTQSKKFRCILNELIYCWPYKNQENFSLFYELSSTKSGINLLQILAEDEEFNPKKLKKNYLINLKDNTLCVFSELIHTKKGQRLLSLIFEKDPEAIESTYPIIDQKMNHYGDETYPQSTFLYWLIYHYENTHLLDHFKGIKDEVWAVELSSNYESYSVSRPLEHLEKSESGRALLRKLFLKDSFCNTLLAYQENYVNEVFLDCITNRIQPLLYDSIGHSILRHFLLEQPHYLDELTAESMIQMMPTLKLGNALCAMCFKFTGQDVLIEIMQKRPDIAAKLTFDNFLQEMTDMEIIGFTPLYCLVKSDAGIDTLIKLIPLIPSLQQGLKGLMDKPHNEDMDHCSKLVRQFLDTLNNRELILNVLNETRLQSQATINVNQHTFFALQHEVQASSEQANDSVLNYE